MSNDAVQLRRYAREGEEEAFAELVARYLPLVYSAALRQVGGDENLAEDVSQLVFMALACNATRLHRKEMITGWLYTTTRNIAVKIARGERRRRAREQAFAAMQEFHSQPEAETDWSQVGPVVDEAMSLLSITDRNMLLLRFFEGKDIKTVGATQGISEDAARMRINRTLESLRGLLRQRGVILSAAMLGAVLGSKALGAVPAGLAAKITVTVLAGSTASGGVVTFFLRFLLMSKLKIGIMGTVVAVGIVAPWIINWQAKNRLQEEVQALRLQGEGMDSLLVENIRLSNLVAQAETVEPLNRDQFSELLRLRSEVGRLRQQASEMKNRATARPEREAQDPKVQELNINLPKTLWTFAGYGTPEASLQTLMWARREADSKSLLANLTPEFVENAKKAWGDKFEDEIKSQLPGKPDRVSEFTIVNKEVISDSEVRLMYRVVEQETFGDDVRNKATGTTIMAKRVGDVWRLQP